MEFVSKSVEETAKFAKDFAATLKSQENQATVVGLYGELGSGKTTFMKYLAQALGVREAVQSPTFVIMKIFDLNDLRFDRLAHIDAYRIEKDEEMLVLGWKEMISNPKNLIFIEWPEKIAAILPSHIMVKFEHVSEGERKISVA